MSVIVGMGGLRIEGDLEGAVQREPVGDRIVGAALGDAIEVVEHQLVGDEAARDLGAAGSRCENGERGETLRVRALVVMGCEGVGAQQRIGDRLGAGEKPALGAPGRGKDAEPVATSSAREEPNRSAAGGAVASSERDGGLGAHRRARQRRRIGWVRVGRGAKW